MAKKATVEICYAAYVTTEFDDAISEINEEVWPPQITLADGSVHCINVSDKLGQEFVSVIKITNTQLEKEDGIF